MIAVSYTAVISFERSVPMVTFTKIDIFTYRTICHANSRNLTFSTKDELIVLLVCPTDVGFCHSLVDFRGHSRTHTHTRTYPHVPDEQMSTRE